MNTVTLNMHTFLSNRVRQAEHGTHTRVAASPKYVNTYSTRSLAVLCVWELGGLCVEYAAR